MPRVESQGLPVALLGLGKAVVGVGVDAETYPLVRNFTALCLCDDVRLTQVPLLF